MTTPCIHTTDHLIKGGYGYRWVKKGEEGRTILSHRQAYADKIGIHPFDLPSSLIVRHTCDHRTCVNWDHLISGTQQDNMDDMVQRKRQSKGDTNGLNVLTEQQVIHILKTYSGKRGEKSVIARQYNVVQQTISKLILGQTWKHLPR